MLVKSEKVDTPFSDINFSADLHFSTLANEGLKFVLKSPYEK